MLQPAREIALTIGATRRAALAESRVAALHITPHYREQTQLASTLAKIQPGSDEFLAEPYAEQIASLLFAWRNELLSGRSGSISELLASDFTGTPLLPRHIQKLRGGPIACFVNSFDPDLVTRADFIRSALASLQSFATILVADFQITRIELQDTSSISESRKLSTTVRYELVGTGATFHREQRVGYWEIDWQESPDKTFAARRWRVLNEAVSRAESPLFLDISAHVLGHNASYSSQLQMGLDHWRTVLDAASGIDVYGHNGISVGDVDGDGLDDLYVCQPAGLPNRLYKNRGDGTFEDITEESGVGVLENTSCALMADFRNSGRQDLLVVRQSGPLLFINEGKGKFRANPDSFHFAQAPEGTFTGAAAADYNGDGLLDVYFCLYLYYQGTEQYRYPVPYYDAENGPPNFLMRNNGDGTFSDVTAEVGLSRNNRRYSFCCAWADFSGNGRPDLYVVNDFGRKNLYRNNGNGTFTDIAEAAHVSDVGAGMSVSCGDYNNDGLPDLYVANMWTAAGLRISRDNAFQKQLSPQTRALYRKHAMGNSLFRNTSQDSFSDQSATAGTEMGRWSWSSDAWDFDHDGRQDIHVTNGMVSGPSTEDLNSFFWRQVVARSPQAGQRSSTYEDGWNAVNELLRADGTWSGYERNVLYANNGDGTFADVSGAAGMDFIEDGRAFALSDFDRDGRLELFVKNRNAPQLRIVKNAIRDLPPAISFRLTGKESNRDAIGAVITLDTAAGKQSRTLQAGSGFLSQHTKELFFGLGESHGPLRASIRWPSGKVQEFENLPVQHRIFIVEGEAGFIAKPFAASPPYTATTAAIPEQLPDDFEVWLLAPLKAPEFSLNDSAGRTRRLSSMLGTPVLLFFGSGESDPSEVAIAQIHAAVSQRELRIVSVRTDKTTKDNAKEQPWPTFVGSDDMLAAYNIVYRYLFDRRRDMPVPCSMLLDSGGRIVKLFQGRLNPQSVLRDIREIPHRDSDGRELGLPFRGISGSEGFLRNYLSYGSVFFQHGYYEQAEESFREAFSQDPNSAEACYGVGSAQLKLGLRQPAFESFRRATELRASYPDTLANAWNNLGLISAEAGHIQEAIGYFDEALKQQPDYLIALVNLGNAYRQQKQWKEASTAFERAIQIEPADAEANYGLGMVFAQTGETQSASDHLQRALQSRPNYPEALNNLGVLYLHAGKQPEAVESFRRCIQVAPGFDQSYLNLARVYALENRTEDAKQVLHQLLQQNPENPQAQQELQQLGNAPR